MNIYIGNLAGEVTEDMIRRLFAPFGEVSKVAIMRDRRGISKGFGFVEMPVMDAANAAIGSINRTFLCDRILDISQSSPPSGKGGHSKANSRPARFRR